jgi:uncharacterized membrane protein
MAAAILAWIVAIPLLGLATGLRTMPPIAVLCWFAHLGYLPVHGTWALWTAHPVSVAVFSLCAIGEYIGDKLPKTPNRISPFPLAARLVFAGLVGAIVATVLKGAALEGIVLGLVGAIVGSFGGFTVRRDLVEHFAWPDWPVAVAEDLIALACSILGLHLVAR